jgi:CheY-like chemotaxis protein
MNKPTYEESRLPGQGRILLMDDEKLILEVAEKMLSKLGYQITTASEGREAIARFEEAYASKKPFDLVILDLTVPGGMGGEEAVPELLKIDPAIKIMASSGYSSGPIMANYQDSGFCGVIPKPYSLNELSETLSKVLKESL